VQLQITQTKRKNEKKRKKEKKKNLYKMAAQICAKCATTVYPLEMVQACDKSFHKQCFRCKHCDMVISLKNFAAIEGDIFCKPHYLELFRSKGSYTAIKGGDENASSSYNASQGFKGVGELMGSSQKKELKKVETVDKSNPVISSDVKIKKIDRHELMDEVTKEHDLKHAETVDKSVPKIENVQVKKLDRKAFLTEIHHGPETPLEKPDAVSDHSAPIVKITATPKCAKCEKSVYPLEEVKACEKTFHKGCFRCKHCDGQLSLKGFATINNEPYCKPHYLELFKSKGNYKGITGEGGESGSSSFTPSFGGVH